MGSSRLPGKTLLDLGGRSVLANVVSRLRLATELDAIVVATTTQRDDDPIAAEAQRLGVPVFRGSRDDVLARYLGAAQAHEADVIVRVTADCPLLDPVTVDRVVGALTSGLDYASNTIQRTYPRGLDVEAFTVDALRMAAEGAIESDDREHVTLFFYRHAARFRRVNVAASRDHSNHRWTLDTPADLAFLRALFDLLAITPSAVPSLDEVLSTLDQYPELLALNAGVQQKKTSLDR